MARLPRSLEALLADVATSGRGDRAEIFSTPAMLALTADMIEDDSISWETLHPEVVQNLADNTQALVDLDNAQASAVGELNQLSQDLTRLDGNLTTLDTTLAANKLAVDTKMAENDAALAGIPATINNAIDEAMAIPISNERFQENSLTIWPFVNKAIPSGAFSPGAVTGADLADFALTVKKFKDDRHRLY
jgi:hypothetical protein